MEHNEYVTKELEAITKMRHDIATLKTNIKKTANGSHIPTHDDLSKLWSALHITLFTHHSRQPHAGSSDVTQTSDAHAQHATATSLQSELRCITDIEKELNQLENELAQSKKGNSGFEEHIANMWDKVTALFHTHHTKLGIPSSYKPTKTAKQITNEALLVIHGDDGFSGLMINGQRIEKGEFKYTDGTTFRGFFHRNGLPKQGVMRPPPSTGGRTLTGEWDSDGFFENGLCVYANGDMYEGSWGRSTAAPRARTASLFEQEWGGVCRSGFGTYKFKSGNLKKGMWDASGGFIDS